MHNTEPNNTEASWYYSKLHIATSTEFLRKYQAGSNARKKLESEAAAMMTEQAKLDEERSRTKETTIFKLKLNSKKYTFVDNTLRYTGNGEDTTDWNAVYDTTSEGKAAAAAAAANPKRRKQHKVKNMEVEGTSDDDDDSSKAGSKNKKARRKTNNGVEELTAEDDVNESGDEDGDGNDPKKLRVSSNLGIMF